MKKQKWRCVIAIIMCITLFLHIFVNIGWTKVQAVDIHSSYRAAMRQVINDEGNLTLTHGDMYDGPFGYRTCYFSALVNHEETKAYCIDPTRTTPPTGGYRYYVYEGGDPETATYSAASILYQYEYNNAAFRTMWQASMDEANVPDADRNQFNLNDEQSAYFMLHSLVSNCWHGGEIWDAGTASGAYQVAGHQEFKDAFGLFYNKLLSAGHPNGYQVYFVDTGSAYQNVIFANYKPQGKIKVNKQSNNIAIQNANPDSYSLDGAKYGIYASEADAQEDHDCIETLVIQNGSATSEDLQVGTYYVREVEASRGYRLNSEITQVTVEADRTSSVTSNEVMQFPTATLKKVSSDSGLTQNHALYSLSDAAYYVYRDAACTQIAEELILNGEGVVTGRQNAVFTTNEDGSSNIITMIPGRYYVKEVRESKGYQLDPDVYSFTLSADASSTEIIHCTEVPSTFLTQIRIQKEDSEGIPMVMENLQGVTIDGIGGASLSGAVFRIQYYSNYYAGMNDLPASADATWNIITKYNAEGEVYEAILDDDHLSPEYENSPYLYDEEGNIRLPLGTIVLKEVKAPVGYCNMDESGWYQYQGGMTSENSIIMQVKASDDDHDGHYDHTHLYVGELQSNGSISFQTIQDGSPIIAKEEIKRGDISFVKTEQKSGREMDYVFFRITSSSGESHIICTKNGGYYSSTDVPHSHNTNALDALYNANGVYQGPDTQEALAEQIDAMGDCGLWFYGTADSAIWDAGTIDDTKGALRYDNSYLIEELPCPGNEGKQLRTKQIAIYEDASCIWLGNITNIDLPELHTMEWDLESGNHNSPVFYDQKSTIMDTVTYTNLPEETTYTLKGVLMELMEDGTVKGPLMTEDGHTIQSVKTFRTGTSSYAAIPYVNGQVEMQYECSSRTFAGKSFVIYEYLYEGEDLTPLVIEEKEVQTDRVYRVQGKPVMHADAEDYNQIGRFLSLHTRAFEHSSNANFCEISELMQVSDVVNYTALTPGYEYRLYGELVYQDLASNEVKPVYDMNGKAVTATMYFVPDTEDGSINLDLPEFAGEQFFDEQGEMICTGIVVYETLYWNNKMVLAARDITDSEETIYFMKKEPIPVKLLLHKQEEILEPKEKEGYVIGRKDAEGVRYGIYNREELTLLNLRTVIPKDTLLYTIQTDEKGYACLEEAMPEGSYYCKELQASGVEYVIDDTEYDFTVKNAEEGDEVVSIDLTPDTAFLNRYKCQQLKLMKVNGDQEAIAGVEFALYRQYGDAYQLIGTYCTDKKGIITIDRVPYGNYYFLETKGAEGYMFDGDKQYTFEVLEDQKEGDGISLVVMNEKTPVSSKPSSPKTGDTSVPFLWWIALIAAGGILAYYLIIRHNRHRR